MTVRTAAMDAPLPMIQALVRCLTLCLLASMAQAQSLNLIGASPVSRFTEADLKLMMATIDRVLADPADGVAQAWNNEATAASGVVTAARSYVSEGRKCRDLIVANRFRTLRGEAEHSFCQDGTGKWKLVQ